MHSAWRRDARRITRVLFGKGYLCVLCSVSIRYKLFCFALKDFETSGVFEAQSVLESRHREEEERLQRFLLEEREKEMRKLDDTISSEKDRAAADLLGSFEHMSMSGSTPNLMAERERIEDHFRRTREEKLKVMMDKIATEEKTRTAKMLDRHGQEMLLLIAKKVHSNDSCTLN